jgi:hypothetical protein
MLCIYPGTAVVQTSHVRNVAYGESKIILGSKYHTNQMETIHRRSMAAK